MKTKKRSRPWPPSNLVYNTVEWMWITNHNYQWFPHPLYPALHVCTIYPGHALPWPWPGAPAAHALICNAHVWYNNSYMHSTGTLGYMTCTYTCIQRVYNMYTTCIHLVERKVHINNYFLNLKVHRIWNLNYISCMSLGFWYMVWSAGGRWHLKIIFFSTF